MTTAETQLAPNLGPKALLSHLRDHPESRFKHPRDLAKEFELPIEFVEEVLTKAESQPSHQSRATEDFYREISSINRRLKKTMDDFARHPTGFVVVSTALAEVILLVLSMASGKSLIHLAEHKNALTNARIVVSGPGIVIPFLMVCAQMVLYYRRAVVRFALFGALAFFVVGGFGLFWSEWDANSGMDTMAKLTFCLLVLIAHLTISMIYAAAGSFLALMGEFQKVLRENRRVEKMTRQELLERLFQLQSRMEMAKSQPIKKMRKGKLTALVKPRLFAAAAIGGFFLQVLYNVTVGPKMIAIFSAPNQVEASALTLFLSSGILVLVYVANFWFAYVAPKFSSALIVGLLYMLGGLAAKLLWLPSQATNHDLHMTAYLVASFIALPIRDVGIAAIAGVIGAIQTKTLEDLSLQRNDEATLIAEQLKIQWRLAQDACSTTVLVIDVVKSTLMKEGEDPLTVEYSFRRLQQWFEDIAAGHGGSVRSTAGDSAVISFPTCHNAFLAATEIQRRMNDFNANWNRLQTQFRVRCGLHIGEVQGDLGKIQFAQVIDIAAHMQKMAPSGGIAATQEIVSSLGASSFVPLAIKSDGKDVYLALDPMGP